MLEELAKQHNKWIGFALKICNDEDMAQDLVQDMYLRLANYKQFNNSLVYKTLKNLFLDHIRLRNRQKNVSIENLHYLKDESESTRQNLKDLDECLKHIKTVHREVLKITSEHSLRKSQDLTGVHYTVLNYHKHLALKKLKILYNGKKRKE